MKNVECIDAGFYPYLSTGIFPHENSGSVRDKSSMDQVDLFLDRIEQARAAAGPKMTERAISLAGGGPDIIRDSRRRHGLPKNDAIEKMAGALGVSVDWLLGKTDEPTPLEANAQLSDRKVAWRDPAGRGDLPILGTALGHSFFEDGEQTANIEQTIFEPGEVIKFIARPAALVADRFAYAVYIQGDSMSPRFEPGEIAVATTRKPPQHGDDVIVQLLDDHGDGEDDARVISVLIKRLVRRSASWVELRQFNPSCTFRVPADRIKHIHRITHMGDLLGA